MNRVPLARRTQIIHCLVEGNSIRSTERMTNTHRDTIMRLMVEVGGGCARLMDEEMRDLSCQRLQVDEIWSYVGKKQAQLKPGDDRSRLSDQWAFVALDPDTKLVPAHLVGKRTRKNAVVFMNDLSERLHEAARVPPMDYRDNRQRWAESHHQPTACRCAEWIVEAGRHLQPARPRSVHNRERIEIGRDEKNYVVSNHFLETATENNWPLDETTNPEQGNRR